MADKSTYNGLKDYASSISLKGDQQAAINSLDTFLSSDDAIFLLKGYAGTGKTHIVKILTEYFEQVKRDVKLLAPTGKAAQLLTQKTGLKASTIHGIIYLHKEEFNNRSKVSPGFTFSLSKRPAKSTVVIVDEASMISDAEEEGIQGVGKGGVLSDLLHFLTKGLLNSMNKTIFIGDTAQLPPIMDNYSKALSEGYFLKEKYIKVSSYEMGQVIRQQSDSGILRNATELRNRISSADYTPFSFDLDTDDVERIQEKSIAEVYLKNMLDGRGCVIITSTNKIARKHNFEVKKMLSKGDTKIAVGDLLIISRNNPHVYKSFFNGTIVEVIHVYPKPIIHSGIKIRKGRNGSNEVAISYRKVTVELVHEEEKEEIECLIIEDHLYSNDGSLTNDMHQALHADFEKRNPSLKRESHAYLKARREDVYFNALQVKYAYAVTAHKAQGSEWGSVIVQFNEKDLSQPNENRMRWMYTAVTRAKEKLFIVQTKSRKGGERKSRKERKPRKPRDPRKRLTANTSEIVIDVDDSINAEIKEKELTPIVLPDTGDAEELLRTHGLTNKKEFKQSKFVEVMLVLKKNDMDVLKIHHDRYEERYIIESDNGKFDVIFAFNGQDVFTRTYTNSKKLKAKDVCNLFK